MCLPLCSPLDLRLLKWVTFLLLWLGCKGQRVPARASRVSGTSTLGIWSGSWREEIRMGFSAPPQGDKASSVAAWHRARLQGCHCASKSDSWLLGLSWWVEYWGQPEAAAGELGSNSQNSKGVRIIWWWPLWHLVPSGLLRASAQDLPWCQPGSQKMQAEKVAQSYQPWWDMLGLGGIGAALMLGGSMKPGKNVFLRCG